MDLSELLYKTIAFPHSPGIGGPGSFQIRLEYRLKKYGCNIVYSFDKIIPDVIIVIGGTKRLFWLYKMKQKGIPILYRLDGLAWLHRQKNVSIKTYLLSEFRNASSKLIHAFIADHIIYQSRFVKDWWERSGWRIKEQYTIIYNGVEPPESASSVLKSMSPNRLVVLEGTIDYSPFAVDLLNELARGLPANIEIEVYGRLEDATNEDKLHSRIQYHGSIPREKVFEVLKGSVYLSLDVNPACPNTVIEAQSVGAPVVAYSTGAIPEILDSSSPLIVNYGGDPWQQATPDFDPMISAVKYGFDNYSSLSERAKANYFNMFTIDRMVDSYVEVIEKTVSA